MSDSTKIPTRDEIRTKIFGTKPKGEVLEVYGTQVEFRQPSLGAVLDLQQEEDRKAALINMIIQFAYVPGTQEKVFSEEDYDGMIGLPFDENIQKIQDMIGELTGAVVTDATKSGTPQEQSQVGGDDGGSRAEAASVGSEEVDKAGA